MAEKGSPAHQRSKQLTPGGQPAKTSWTRTLVAGGANVIVVNTKLPEYYLKCINAVCTPRKFHIINVVKWLYTPLLICEKT
jgi:hypothetical protein